MKKLLFFALLMLLSAQIFGQEFATGVVKNDKGEILAGATVTEKGTNNSTLTNTDGTFKLKMTSSKEIVVSMAGYEKTTVKVNPDGSVPDIILEKAMPRVAFGVKAGAEYCITEFESDIEDNYSYFSSTTSFDVDFKNTVGVNAGLYMDLNFGRTFSFELGLQLYKKTLEADSIKLQCYDLNIPIAVCKWRMGKRKHYFMTWGPTLDVLFFESENEADIMNEMTKTQVGVSLYYSTGYEFKSGFGFRLNARGGVSGILFPDDSYYAYGYYSFGGALTYRF